MPRYFLNIRNNISFTRDEEGCELANADAARDVAVHGARSLMGAEVADQGRLDLRARIEVLDEAGKIVLIVPFREALDIVENNGDDDQIPPQHRRRA
jgi:hypothetical protein